MDNEAFLQEQQTELNGLLRPFQREVTRQQRLADFVTRCIRSAGRDDFFQIYELLNSRMAADLEKEAGFEDVSEVFERLRQDANKKVELYQVQFIWDFTRLVEEAGLPLENDFPRLRLLKGIDLEVNFQEKQTKVNGKVLKTVEPARIMRQVIAVKRRLYDRAFDPQSFIDGLLVACKKVIQAEGGSVSSGAPIQLVYREYTLAQQPRSFFQDMAKGRFREYDADQFSVDFWRYFNSDVSSTTDGYVPHLNSGRNHALYLLDQTGEKRQVTSLSFHQG